MEISNDVQPNITPSINGKVFLNPKLNPEYAAEMLLGPGVKAVTNPKRNKE
tara:strand:- start:243 stop:395 length:153 start_codon:yes stop_codon:yes gene_type:complete